MYHGNRALFIHLNVFNQIELNSIILKIINDKISSHNWTKDDDVFDHQV